MEAETTPPGRGSPESAAWFREKLEELGLTEAAMARFAQRYDDNRKAATIARGIRRMATGEARVSGEVRQLLSYVLADKAFRKRQIAMLERDLEAFRSGRMRSISNDGVIEKDTTAEWVAILEKRLSEWRDLPFVLLAERAVKAAE